MEFNKLVEQYLNALNEAPISGDVSQIAPEIVSKAKDAPMSGHWKLLKKQEDMEKAVIDILNHVLPENNNTYNPDIDTPEELKKAIKDAVEEITTKKGWAAKFLSDRLSTIVLKKVAFDVANQAMTSKKEVTQKEVKQALNKALEQKPATVSTEEDTVYYRSADLDSDDADLVKAFNKLPAEGNIKWSDIIAKIGEDLASQLKKAGALIEVVGGEEEEDEEKEIPALEFDDEDDTDISSSFDKIIDPYFSTTKDDYFRD
jgi:hypothetical protein